MSNHQALEQELKAVHASLSEVKDMLFSIKTADDNSKGLKEVVEEIVSNIHTCVCYPCSGGEIRPTPIG